MTKQIDELVSEWRARGPVAWAEGVFGWIGIDGQPVRLEPWQRSVLLAWFEHKETCTTFAISNTKKTGKTFVNAVLLAWRWLALPGLHFAVANDLDQAAARQFQEIADMCKRNPFLRDNVKISAKSLEFIPTGAVLAALAGDASGNAGANHLTVSHTEAWGVIYEADVRNWEELTPPPGKFYGLPPLRIADSYAGYLEESTTWHELVDRGLEGQRIAGEWPIYQDGGLLLFHMSGQEAHRRCFRGTPGEAAIYYRDQRAALRENTYKRLHENTRTVNTGTFVDQEVWEGLVDPELQPLAAGSSRPVYVGLDLALAAGGDNCALIGVYFDGGKVKTAFHKVWKGGIFRRRKLNLSETVEPYILTLAKNYNLQGVYFDPWQAIHMAESLRAAGVTCIEVSQTHSNRGPKDTALYELAVNGQLALYDDQELRQMTAGANAKELSNGQLFLQKAGGRSKIDLLVALSNAADVCNSDGQGFTGAEVLPNTFYAYEGWDPERDFVYYSDGSFSFAPEHNTKPHPAGVTWRTCRHRNKGCAACAAEMDADGTTAQLRTLDESIVPMTEEQALSLIYKHSQDRLQAQAEREYRDAQIVSNFRKAAGRGI